MALIELNIEHFNATELHMKLTEIKMGGLGGSWTWESRQNPE